MYYRKDATGVVSETIEDLDISLDENLFIGDAEVDCMMEYEGYDPGDWYTPPSVGCGWCYDTTVKSVTIYTEGGVEYGKSTDEKHLKKVQDWIEETDWMNENSDRLMEIWPPKKLSLTLCVRSELKNTSKRDTHGKQGKGRTPNKR